MEDSTPVSLEEQYRLAELIRSYIDGPSDPPSAWVRDTLLEMLRDVTHPMRRAAAEALWRIAEDDRHRLEQHRRAGTVSPVSETPSTDQTS